MTQHAFTRALLERDLRARSQVARFGILQQREDWQQGTLALTCTQTAEESTDEQIVDCDHVGTGRASQARFFGEGFDLLCTRCGATVDD